MVQARGTLSEADAARVAHDVLQVLQECHRQGILYAVSVHADSALPASLVLCHSSSALGGVQRELLVPGAADCAACCGLRARLVV